MKKASSQKTTTLRRKSSTKKRTTTKNKATTKKKTTAKKSSSRSSSGGSFSGDDTYYITGLGSCGIINKDIDLIAALNAPQMQNVANPNNNPLCGKHANVHGPKGTVKVKIVDTCPPCVKGDLDLSPGCFR